MVATLRSLLFASCSIAACWAGVTGGAAGWGSAAGGAIGMGEAVCVPGGDPGAPNPLPYCGGNAGLVSGLLVIIGLPAGAAVWRVWAESG